MTAGQELAAARVQLPDLVAYIGGMRKKMVEAQIRRDVRAFRHNLTDSSTGQHYWLMTVGVN